VGADARLEARVATTPPLALYAALICDVRGRIGAHPSLGEARPGLAAWSREEYGGLESSAATALTEGRDILAALAFDTAG
jgi:hypothetical protein